MPIRVLNKSITSTETSSSDFNQIPQILNTVLPTVPTKIQSYTLIFCLCLPVSESFLADRTNGRAIGTLFRLSVCLSSVTLCIVAKGCVLEQTLLSIQFNFIVKLA